jgi:hypothetical protein
MALVLAAGQAAIRPLSRREAAAAYLQIPPVLPEGILPAGVIRAEIGGIALIAFGSMVISRVPLPPHRVKVLRQRLAFRSSANYWERRSALGGNSGTRSCGDLAQGKVKFVKACYDSSCYVDHASVFGADPAMSRMLPSRSGRWPGERPAQWQGRPGRIPSLIDTMTAGSAHAGNGAKGARHAGRSRRAGGS